MRRILVFLAVNAAVVIALSVILNLLGVQPYLTQRGMNLQGLLIFCALFGMGGAFISLQLSRWMAKRAMGVVLVDPNNPRDQAESFLLERVHELCQKTGMRTLPEIGIYPSNEVNAFATGRSPDNAGSRRL